MRDYADACIRYLRATGLVSISHVGRSISLESERLEEVDYILTKIDRQPGEFASLDGYLNYLGDAKTPTLLSDNKDWITKKIEKLFPDNKIITTDKPLNTLKEILSISLTQRKSNTIQAQILAIKNFREYDDIQDLFKRIQRDRNLYDAPLLLEWNVWRGMTMLNGGKIYPNLRFDDLGKPLSTAQGNKPDIVCDYETFLLAVEVTMASGQRQYEMEGESISRHLGKLRQSTEKPAYCLFIAPTIHPSCIAHFFVLHRVYVSAYGGTSSIVPLLLALFVKMLDVARQASYSPNSSHILQFLEYSRQQALASCNELAWFDAVQQKATNWLAQ